MRALCSEYVHSLIRRTYIAKKCVCFDHVCLTLYIGCFHISYSLVWFLIKGTHCAQDYSAADKVMLFEQSLEIRQISAFRGVYCEPYGGPPKFLSSV